MIHDLQTGFPDGTLHTDVCVIGAGAAGIALAVSLAAHGRSVTLLEGGGRTVEPESQVPYRSESSALAHRGLHEGRFRALGGTTHRWGGQILELDASDFDARSWVRGSGWPFPKTTLAPYYKRALALEGLTGAIEDDAAVWRAVGEEKPELPCLETYVSRWCPEPNFAHLHREALEREGIHVWLHSNAVELLMEGEQVTGVRCRTLDGREATFRADRYCFALGAIESSRFFLQPRPAGSLPWNSSGLLGCHFQDHIDLDAAVVTPRSPARFHASFDAIFLGGFKYNPKLRLDAATQRSHQILHAGATFYTASEHDEALTAMKQTARHLLRGRVGEIGGRDAWNLIRNGPLLARQTWRYAVDHRAFHPAGAQLRMRVHCEQEPATATRITLSADRCTLGLLRTELSWQISALERRTIRQFLALARESLAPLATLVSDPALDDDGQLDARAQDSFHHMGGMRIDASPRLGVVDTDLKLHGTRNAYVCSTAVYPTSGFSNPTHTLLALAVRLADHLALTA